MNWSAKAIKHKGTNRIAIYFEKNEALNARIKKLEGVCWSKSLGAWHLPDTDAYRLQFKIEQRMVPNSIHLQKIAEFKRWLASKRYASSTIKTYSEALKSFLAYFNEKGIDDFVAADLITYNNDYILRNKLSSSYQNQIVNAIKLFFKSIEHQKMNPELQKPCPMY